MTAQTPSSRSAWPFAILVSFVAVFGVNIYMIFVATRSNLGEFVTQSYERGLKYQEEIDARRAFISNAWQSQVTIGPRESTGALIVKVSVLDANNSPVPGLNGKVYAFRPSNQKMDQTADMNNLADGAYVAKFTVMNPGLWKFRIEFKNGSQALLLEQDIIL